MGTFPLILYGHLKISYLFSWVLLQYQRRWQILSHFFRHCSDIGSRRKKKKWEILLLITFFCPLWCLCSITILEGKHLLPYQEFAFLLRSVSLWKIFNFAALAFSMSFIFSLFSICLGFNLHNFIFHLHPKKIVKKEQWNVFLGARAIFFSYSTEGFLSVFIEISYKVCMNM